MKEKDFGKIENFEARSEAIGVEWK